MIDQAPDPKLTVPIVGGLFGLLSTLIPVVDKWMRERSSQQQADQQLDRITKEVAFWDAWFKAQQAVSGQDELEQARAIVVGNLKRLTPRQASLGVSAQQIQVLPTSFMRRLILAYKPVRASAWVPRVFFYVFLTYLCAAIFVTFRPPIHTPNDPLVWLLMLLLVILVWLFRFLSIRLESGIGRAAQ